MLRGVLVGQHVRLNEVVHQLDLAVVPPGRLGHLACRHPWEQVGYVVDDRTPDTLGGGDKHAGEVGTVLGLAEQVDGHGERVGVLVRDDEGLGRSREQVDADLTEELTLGFGHVGVARAGEHVDAVDGLRAESQSGDGLYPSHHEDLVGLRQVHSGDAHDRRLPEDGWRGRRDPLDATTLAVSTVMCADAVRG